MNQKELKELIEFLIEKDIAEFELERGDVKVRVKRTGEHTVVSAPPHMSFTHHAPAPLPAQENYAAPATLSAPAKAASAEEKDVHNVKSPIVGTYYESPSPGS